MAAAKMKSSFVIIWTKLVKNYIVHITDWKLQPSENEKSKTKHILWQ